ncbi:hypothetical protein MMPV_002954 [Pyropia vietnamensis]
MDLEAPIGSPSAAASWATATALTLAAYVVPRERVFFADDLEEGPRCFDGGVYALQSVPQGEREGGGGDHSAFRGMSYHAWNQDAQPPEGGAGSPAGAPMSRAVAANSSLAVDEGVLAETGARTARGAYVPMSPVAQRAGFDLIRAALHARFHLHPSDRMANRRDHRPPPHAHRRHGSRWARRAMAAAAAAARAEAVASPVPVTVLLDARPDAATLRWEATGPLLGRLRGMRRVDVPAQKDGMSLLSFGDQVRAFASADVVVAPQGAGLANLLAVRPGTRVVVVWPCCWEGGDLDDPATTAGSWTAAVAPLLRVHLSYIKCAELDGPTGYRLAALTVEERQTPGWVCRWGHPRFSPRRFVTPVVPTLEALSAAIDAVRSGDSDDDVGTRPGTSAAKANAADNKEQMRGGLSPGPAFARLVATYEATWAPQSTDTGGSARQNAAGGWLGTFLKWLFGDRAALVGVAVATLVGVTALFALVLASAAASTRRRPKPPAWEAHGGRGDAVLGGGRREGGTRRRLRA